jgi:chaperonin GroEL
MDYTKAKSAAKVVNLRGPELDAKVLATMKTIADAVGATLGPGGAPVLIERGEYGMPNMVTKDGVTVMRSLGFSDPTAHSIMESARDAAVRTVGEAGDGTTTATVLAYALVRHAQQFHEKNPRVAPQRIVQDLQAAFDEKVEPLIRKLSKRVDFGSKRGKKLLRAVATISANGDVKLADAVMDAFEQVGDQGNVSIIESSGPWGYKVERIEGFPIPVGYEDSCGRFMTEFINDGENHRVFMKDPMFLLYNGTLIDVQNLLPLLEKLQNAWNNRPSLESHDPNLASISTPNVVLVANGFSEAVLASLSLIWKTAHNINVLPVMTPRSAIQNGEVHFLDDLASITGATVLNPLTRPFDSVTEEFKEFGRVRVVVRDDVGALLDDRGNEVTRPGEFEMHRFRSTVVGRNDEEEVLDRAETLEGMVESAISELDARLLRERLAALTGGIAKLTVVGSSAGELRERKDRADDAVRAVQGAIKHGVLPGGGWTLLKVAQALAADPECPKTVRHVLVPALYEPVTKLLANIGMPEDERVETIATIEAGLGTKMRATYNAAKGEFVDAFKDGLLDSTPAVREAIRNSISIASLLGTLGGVVVFDRDVELERRESMATSDFTRNSNVNEANERA